MKESTLPEEVPNLSQFIGTENWYRHGLNPFVTYTDGARYLAETASAYWLLDEIATRQLQAKIRQQPFQAWKLVRQPEGDGATLTVEDGNGHQIDKAEIPFTDFPARTATLWFSNNVIMLRTEY